MRKISVCVVCSFLISILIGEVSYIVIKVYYVEYGQ